MAPKRASTPGRSSPAPRKTASSPLASEAKNGHSKATRWSLILAGFLALLSIFFYTFETKPHYIFEPERLHKISQSAVQAHGNDTALIFDEILRQLHADPKLHPTLNKNSVKDSSEWVFNNAGGAMGAMYLIHSSITEYLIFFGTPVGTEGHTGRHTADDYFHILTGHQYAYPAGALVPEVYGPGSQHHLRRGLVKQYMMPEEGCWALELAQGWIPPMLPFGFADTLSSTLDFPTFLRTVIITAREMIGNLLIGKF